MTSKPGEQTIAVHILPNISRSKDIQAMKLGQLIEYIKKNIFFAKVMHKIMQRDKFQTPFCFLKKLNMT